MGMLGTKLTAIANAIRSKTGGAGPLTLDGMAQAITGIETRRPEQTKPVIPSPGPQTVLPDEGHVLSRVDVAGMPAGQLATPTVSPDGLVTAQVSAGGYLPTGGAKTLQLSTLGAQTIQPGLSAQTLAAGKYLTGTQTIAAITASLLGYLDPDFRAENVLAGVNLFGLVGSLAVKNYYTGTTNPGAGLGSDGDLYFKMEADT